MIRSYQDYRHFLQEAFSGIHPVEIAQFCIWSIERHATTFGEVVYDGLEASGRVRVLEMLTELRDVISSRALLSAPRARELQTELLTLGPHDDVARIEVATEATEYLGAIWSTLEYCISRDEHCARAVSESLINTWDYRVEQSAPEYTLDNMFDHPQMRSEFELQSRYLESLRRPASPN
jgi:hypothetical protein